MAQILTTCVYCGCGCGIYINVDDEGKAIGSSPSTMHPVSKGSLCVKGWNVHEFASHPDRLKTPLIKDSNGQFRRASWDEALTLVASKLKELQNNHGNDSIAFFSSAKVSNEENFLMMKLARAAFKTNNVDHCARLCHASTVLGLAATFGSGAMTNSINEFQDAECILVTGSNTTEQHPMIGSRIIEAVDQKGAKLIVVDPREIRLSNFATIQLKQKSGTDVAWLNGMMHVIIKEDLHDKKFIAERTEGFEELRKVIEKYTPEYVEEITGIPKEELIKAARMYATSKSAMIVYSMGITQHTTGVDNVKSCANLAMLTGNLGKEYAGVNPLRGQNNVQGACDAGALPNVFSGYQKVDDPQVKEKFEQAWGVSDLPTKPGLTVTTAINSACDGTLKGLYIMGENPMVSDPDLNHVEKGLRNLDFLVVQDIFLTETAELADVVLPATSFLEKDGTFTSTERRVMRIRKALNPLYESREDWRILCDVAQKVGYNMSYNSPSEIMDEMARLTPIYGGVSFDRLEGDGLQWPCPNKEHPGTPVLHKGKFTKGLGTFTPVEFIPPSELPDENYDLILTTGRSYWHFHTRTMTRRTQTLEREMPKPFVEINTKDAQKRKIRNGQLVTVCTRRGEININADVSDKVPEGTIFIPFHFAECAANKLTINALDPQAKIPEYKVCSAKVLVTV